MRHLVDLRSPFAPAPLPLRAPLHLPSLAARGLGSSIDTIQHTRALTSSPAWGIQDVALSLTGNHALGVLGAVLGNLTIIHRTDTSERSLLGTSGHFRSSTVRQEVSRRTMGGGRARVRMGREGHDRRLRRAAVPERGAGGGGVPGDGTGRRESKQPTRPWAARAAWAALAA